jgi:hypothetical protein
MDPAVNIYQQVRSINGSMIALLLLPSYYSRHENTNSEIAVVGKLNLFFIYLYMVVILKLYAEI